MNSMTKRAAAVLLLAVGANILLGPQGLGLVAILAAIVLLAGDD